MHIDVQLTNQPIPEKIASPAAEHAGAWVEFRGVVRGEENGAAIAALEYEAYSPMAENEMRRLIREICRVRPCLAARVIHRIGVIPVGETAIYVGIAGKHRAEAFAKAWGSTLVDAGNLGHIGSASKLGLWPFGLFYFGQFIGSLA